MMTKAAVRKTKLPKVSRRKLGSPPGRPRAWRKPKEEYTPIPLSPDCHPTWTVCPTCENDFRKCAMFRGRAVNGETTQ